MNDTYTDLDALLAELISGDTDLDTDLPIYGDPDRNNPEGVWSWDDTREIVGTCQEDLEIVNRTDCEDA